MNVLNRNMFRNRDSRNRLAQMGGILSSSPELQETAMTFANGGGADLDTKFILTNIPELGIREGQFVKISAKTLEGLNNAIPEVMARHGDKVKSVELMMSERNSALVALAREGDALIGTRVNRLLEQRAADSAAAPDLAPVPIPPAIAEISSPTASTQDNIASINGVDIETVRRIRDSDAKRSEAALIESLAPNNAQGQPGGILGARYPESDMPLTMLNTQRAIESLVKGTPYSGELSPSQTARNQETLRDTLQRERIAQQRQDSIEKRRIAQDAADTRKAFSVPLESGIAKAVPIEVDSEAERLLQAERERVLKLQALNKGPESAVTPAEELQSVTPDIAEFAKYADQYTTMRDDRVRDAKREEITRKLLDQPDSVQGSGQGLATDSSEGSIFDTAGDYITEFFLNPEIQGKINSAIEQSQAATAEAVQKRIGPAIAASEDAVKALDVKEAIDAMDARNEAGPYRITAPVKTEVDPVGPNVVFDVLQSASDAINPDESFVPRKDRGTVITANPEGAGTVSLDPLKAAVPIAKTTAEVAAAMAGFGSDVLGDDVKGVSKSVGDADQQLAEEQVSAAQEAPEPEVTEDAPDKSTELLTQLELARTTGQVESGGSPLSVTKDVKTTIDDAGDDAGVGRNIAGDGGIADLTKGYVKVLKSLLGESDEDKAARKGELFMLMGAALMSGKSSNALTNIGDALQIGAKAAIQDRTTRKKRDDTIGLKGFEMAADRIAKREATADKIAAENRAFTKDKLLLVERLENAKDLAEFNSTLGKTYIKSGPYKSLLSEYKQARETFDDLGADISKEDRELGFANYFTKRMLLSGYDPLDIQTFNLYQGRSSLPSGTGGGGESLDIIQ